MIKRIRKFLQIQEANDYTINIKEIFTYDGNLAKNIIWYRGKANELHELYRNIDDSMGQNSFWAASPTRNCKLRKIHTGLPGLIVKMLTKVVVDDLDSINIYSDEKDEAGKFKKSDRQEVWKKIAKANKFKRQVKKSVTKALYMGDGAFKISYDSSISEYPIIEFYGADRVNYVYKRGQIVEVQFQTRKVFKNKNYILIDHYTSEGITYSLEDEDGKEVALDSFEETKQLNDITVKNNYNFMLAIPFIIEESEQYEGRGKSIFDGKEDAFDSFDEVWSQWIDAIRKGRAKTYIPEALIPRDPKTGILLTPNEFDTNFVATEKGSGENDKNEIVNKQAEIPSESLLSAYTTALDLCLQGLISPSTLGIDVKKLDNGEAQREKEKATLYTRNDIVEELQEVIKEVVNTSLKVYDVAQIIEGINSDTEIHDYNVDVQFGEYANPSFEAQVETVGKASTTNVMSIEAQVEQLWGDTKDEKWKKEEVERIKEEKGIVQMPEPAINLDLMTLSEDNE